MKLSRHLLTIIAIIATGTAQAGYVTPTTIWKDSGEMVLGQNPDNVSGFTLDVKDGDTEAIVTKGGTTTSGLFVREGKLTIGGTDEHITLTINPNGGGQLDDFQLGGTATVLNVAGKDAVAVIDNATVKTDLKTASAVGGPDGNGTLIIQNGAKYDGGSQYYFFIGYKSYRLEGEDPNHTGTGEKQQIVHATTNNVNDSRSDSSGAADFSNRYEGTYTPGAGGTQYGKGVVVVTGNSQFNATGIDEFCIGHGELHIRENSVVNTSERPMLVGYGFGVTSIVNVESGSVWNINGQLQTSQYANSTTIINVADASVNLNNAKGAFLGVKSGGGTTEFNLLENGKLKVSDELYVGYASSATLTVAETATINSFGNAVDCVIVEAAGTVVNRGAMNISVKMAGGHLTNTGSIVCDELVLNGGTLRHSGSLTVNKALTLNSGVLEIVLTEANQEKEAITLGSGTSVTVGSQASTFALRATPGGMLIRLIGGQNVKAGSKFIIFNQEVDLSTATIEGVDVDVSLVGGETVLTLLEDVYVGRDSRADVALTSAWGAFKASHAFANTLWQPRPAANCAMLGKNSVDAHKKTVWASAFTDYSRLSGNGADYALHGAAVGVESELSNKRSIGMALGYGFGKVSPFNTTSLDQQSMHLGVYGRAYSRCINATDSVTFDWSAAYGNTTAEHDAVQGEWKHNSLQLDARATYHRVLSEKTTGNAFVGAQYYTQDSDTADGIKSDSINNLRFMAGVGISHALTTRTALFAEAMLHGDAVRHNPETEVDGFDYTGTNPGRIGGTISAGVDYQINDAWNLRANYSYSTADEDNSHSVNAGAVYKF